MKITPITNQRINNKTTFQRLGLGHGYGSGNPIVQEAEMVLRNCKLATREQFTSGRIHQGLAQLTYFSDEKINNLIKLYRHAISELGLKMPERTPDIAIREGLKNQNYEYLRTLIDNIGEIPVDRNEEIPFDILIDGKSSPHYRIRDLFDTEYLRRKSGSLYLETKPYTIIEGSDIFDEMMLMSGINRFDGIIKPTKIDKRPVIGFAKRAIEKDEELFGTPKLETLFKIVSLPEFEYIKDDSLNISGSKLLHLLAEIYINPNNKTDMFYLKSIIKSCRLIGYDFDVKNDFGETALDKAREAKCKALIDALLPYKGKEYYD